MGWGWLGACFYRWTLVSLLVYLNIGLIGSMFGGGFVQGESRFVIFFSFLQFRMMYVIYLMEIFGEGFH